jgi:hypothetical protein
MSVINTAAVVEEEANMIQSGQHGRFYWLVAPSLPPSLVAATLRFHPGARLCITSYDSGLIRPSPEEQARGWITRGNVMISPPLAEGLDIPYDQYDEWYLLDESPPPEWEPEVFVNYGGFTPVASEEINKMYDPTWDRHGLDCLAPIQERFWGQLEQVDPISYIAMGDRDVVVSKRREFIEHLRARA